MLNSRPSRIILPVYIFKSTAEAVHLSTYAQVSVKSFLFQITCGDWLNIRIFNNSWKCKIVKHEKIVNDIFFL